MKMSQNNPDNDYSSNPSTSLSSADFTCLVPTFTNSASSAFENNHNGDIGVYTQQCNESLSNIDSAQAGISENSLELGTFDSLEESELRSVSCGELIRPLYKYIKDKKCLLCGFESGAKDFSSVRKHMVVHITNKGFKCNVCDKRFTTKKYLLKHHVLHSDNFPFSCDLCDKKFQNKSRFNGHRRRVHGQKQKWKCEVCDKNLSTKVSLKQHLRIHTGERPHVCPICKEAFHVKCVLTRHIHQQHGSHPHHQCVLCSVTFASSSELENHECSFEENLTQNSLGSHDPVLLPVMSSPMYQSNADDVDSSNLCVSFPSVDSNCALTSSTCENNHDLEAGVCNEERDISESGVDSTDETPESSLEIGTFDSLSEGDQKSTSYRELIRPLYKYMESKICLLCGYESQAKDLFSARQHLLVHVRNKLFKCDICGKRFSTEKYMLRHYVVHSSMFPISCDLCDKKFRDKSRMYNHRRRIHRQNRKWKCEVCDKDFTTHVYLREHLRVHTGELPHVCPICKEAFRAKYSLVTHLRRRHASLTPYPYKCECGKKFVYRHSFQQHKLVGKCLHSCSVCGLMFKLARQLKSHIQIHQTSVTTSQEFPAKSENPVPETSRSVPSGCSMKDYSMSDLL